MTATKIIAVFGANGRVGREFIKMALKSGYSLRALVRNRTSIAFDNDTRVEVIEGDATNADDVVSAVAGADVVTSFLGNPGRGVQIMFAATDNIMTAAAAQPNRPRCLMISSIGVGGSSWLVKGMLILIGGRAGFEDYERAEARVRNETTVPFVVIRPYALTDKPATGRYKVIPGNTAHIAKAIPRADVAKFFLDSVKDTGKVGSCVNIGGV